MVTVNLLNPADPLYKVYAMLQRRVQVIIWSSHLASCLLCCLERVCNYLNQTGHLKLKKVFEGNSLWLCAACEEGQLQITAQSSCVKNSLKVKAFVILVLTQFAISWSLFFNYRYLLKDSCPLSISHLHTWKLQILTTV